MIPSARLLEEGSITMASMAPVDLSDLEKKKIDILSDTYCNELQNDMAVYKHFRQGQKCTDHDWNGAMAMGAWSS